MIKLNTFIKLKKSFRKYIIFRIG